jgi:hypothetical protein
MIVGKEMSTFSGFSCRLDEVEHDRAGDHERLIFTLPVRHKHGRHKHQHDIAVPPGETATVQRRSWRSCARRVQRRDPSE